MTTFHVAAMGNKSETIAIKAKNRNDAIEKYWNGDYSEQDEVDSSLFEWEIYEIKEVKE